MITGYEKGDCKEVEVCKHAYWKREAVAEAHYGHKDYGYVECEKEMKEVCKQEPVVEEKSKDREYCKFMPKKVCAEKTFKVPKLVCEEIEEKEAE